MAKIWYSGVMMMRAVREFMREATVRDLMNLRKKLKVIMMILNF
jgi:hypothetical protein